MQFRNLVAILPFVLGMVAAAPAASSDAQGIEWTAFLYTNDNCGQIDRQIVATVNGVSDEKYQVKEFTEGNIRSISMSWTSSIPSKNSGQTVLFTGEENSTVVGKNYGNGCITADGQYYVTSWKTQRCAPEECDKAA